jgi:hypothetical protein
MMKDILKARKDKLTRAYKLNPHIATYARLREVTLLLNKLSQYDKRASNKDTSPAEGGDSPELRQHLPSPSANGGWRKRQIGQQRTWVGLTDEDLKLLSAEWRIVYGAWMDDFARDIEAKLRSKNENR